MRSLCDSVESDALERIAGDSSRDSSSVIEVLSAFVRSGHGLSVSDTTPPINTVAQDWMKMYSRIRQELKLEGRAKASAGGVVPNLNEHPVVDADVEAALTVLARMPRSRASPTIDLSNAKLEVCDLSAVAPISAVREWPVSICVIPGWPGPSWSTVGCIKQISAGAYLHKVNLRGSHLGGVDLTGVQGLTQEQLELTTGDSATILPNYLKRPLKW